MSGYIYSFVIEAAIILSSEMEWRSFILLVKHIQKDESKTKKMLKSLNQNHALI